MPAPAMTSASPSFATCTPAAPASSWMRAIWGSLWVFVCGLTVTPVSRGPKEALADVVWDLVVARLNESSGDG